MHIIDNVTKPFVCVCGGGAADTEGSSFFAFGKFFVNFALCILIVTFGKRMFLVINKSLPWGILLWYSMILVHRYVLRRFILCFVSHKTSYVYKHDKHGEVDNGSTGA